MLEPPQPPPSYASQSSNHGSVLSLPTYSQIGSAPPIYQSQIPQVPVPAPQQAPINLPQLVPQFQQSPPAFPQFQPAIPPQFAPAGPVFIPQVQHAFPLPPPQINHGPPPPPFLLPNFQPTLPTPPPQVILGPPPPPPPIFHPNFQPAYHSIHPGQFPPGSILFPAVVQQQLPVNPTLTPINFPRFPPVSPQFHIAKEGANCRLCAIGSIPIHPE